MSGDLRWLVLAFADMGLRQDDVDWMAGHRPPERRFAEAVQDLTQSELIETYVGGVLGLTSMGQLARSFGMLKSYQSTAFILRCNEHGAGYEAAAAIVFLEAFATAPSPFKDPVIGFAKARHQRASEVICPIC